jgi:hypothetical protein
LDGGGGDLERGEGKGQQLATVKFLVDDAPHDWLSVGKRFTLHENVPLAEGVVEEILSG